MSQNFLGVLWPASAYFLFSADYCKIMLQIWVVIGEGGLDVGNVY